MFFNSSQKKNIQNKQNQTNPKSGKGGTAAMGYSLNFLSGPCGTYSGGEMLFCKKYIIYLTVHNL